MTAGDDNRKTCETIYGAEWVFITAKKRSVPFFLCFVCLDFFIYKTIVKIMIFATFCRANSNQSHPMENSLKEVGWKNPRNVHFVQYSHLHDYIRDCCADWFVFGRCYSMKLQHTVSV